MNYKYTSNPSEVEEIAKQLRLEKSIAVDTETTGLHPHDNQVILLSLSSRKNTYLIDTRDKRCLLACKDLLADEAIAKLGFNLLFDYSMIKGTAGIDLEGCWDLFLGEIALTNGIQFDGRSLAAVTKKYIKKERDKTLQKSFIGHVGEFTTEQLAYAAEDTADLFLIGDEMKKKIIQENLLATWRTENNAIPAYGDMYVYGQKLDTSAWTDLMHTQQGKLLEAKKELDTFFEPVYGQDLFGGTAVNYGSHSQVLYGLQWMGVEIDGAEIESTGKEVQKKIMHLPVIMALNKYRAAETAISRYGQKWLDAINKKTGRIHLQNNQWGTETGRGSGKGGLNDRNIPRDKRYRQCFTTDSDRLISTVDYSGAELRILAELSGDELMIKGFNSGVDFHCFVAAMLFNREKVEKKDPIRQPTKTINFG